MPYVIVTIPKSLMALLLCCIGVLSVSLGSQAGLTVEAEPGDDVTLWCKHSLTRADYIYWCKHTNNSVPVYIACKYYLASSSSSKPCIFIPESSRSVMSVNSTFSSLTITAVTLSDSGLYYCSFLQERQMIFSTATYVQIKDRNRISSKSADGCKEAGCSSALVMLTLCGSVTAVLLSALLILIFIRQSDSTGQREQQRDDGSSEWTEQNEDQDGEMLNYTALHFSKRNRRSERPVRSVDRNVGYSSVQK